MVAQNTMAHKVLITKLVNNMIFYDIPNLT